MSARFSRSVMGLTGVFRIQGLVAVLLPLLLFPQVCALFEQAINAEGLDVDLDQVAAAAMAAVESAVKDEVEAATVVSATKSALATTLQALQAISGNDEEAAAVAELAAALASTEAAAAAALASTDKSGSPTPAADAIQLLDSSTSSAAGAAGAGLLQAVDSGSSNGAPGSSAAPSSAASPAPSPTPMAMPPAYASMDGGKAKQDAAKAKLLQVAGFAVAAALAFVFIKSPAGEVRASSCWGLWTGVSSCWPLVNMCKLKALNMLRTPVPTHCAM